MIRSSQGPPTHPSCRDRTAWAQEMVYDKGALVATRRSDEQPKAQPKAKAAKGDSAGRWGAAVAASVVEVASFFFEIFSLIHGGEWWFSGG